MFYSFSFTIIVSIKTNTFYTETYRIKFHRKYRYNYSYKTLSKKLLNVTRKYYKQYTQNSVLPVFVTGTIYDRNLNRINRCRFTDENTNIFHNKYEEKE